jgi:DNA mismatch repair ATPase MutS
MPSISIANHERFLRLIEKSFVNQEPGGLTDGVAGADTFKENLLELHTIIEKYKERVRELQELSKKYKSVLQRTKSEIRLKQKSVKRKNGNSMMLVNRP